MPPTPDPTQQGPQIDPQMAQNIFALGQHVGSQPDFEGADWTSQLLNYNEDNGDQYPGLGQAPPLGFNGAPGIDPSQYMGGGVGFYPTQMGGGGDSGMSGFGSQGPQGMAPPNAMATMGGQPGMGGGAPEPPPGHPFWRNLGNYLGSDAFKDSLMGGIIAGQMATNPQGALQLAMQWRQHKDQRAFQAQQNQMQRDAIMARFKFQQQAKREEDTARRKAGQLHLAQSKAVQLGISIPEWETNNNRPLDEDSVDDFLGYASKVGEQRKVEAAQAKAQKDTMSQQNAVLGKLFKGEPVGKTPWDGQADWEQMKSAAKAHGEDYTATQKSLRDARLESAKLELKLMDAATKKAAAGENTLQYQQAKIEMNEAYKNWTDALGEIDKLQKGQADSMGTVEYGDMLDQKMRDLPILQQKYELARDTARALVAGKEPPKKEAPTATTQSPTEDDPDAMYIHAARAMGKSEEALRAAWAVGPGKDGKPFPEGK